MPPEVIIGLILLIPLIWTVARYIEGLFFHGRYGGSLKWGIKVWSEPLPEDMKHFLQHLSDDIIDHETGAFIRKEQNVVLIQPVNIKGARRKWLWRRGVDYYVGYIDLRVKKPRVQYRAPFFSFSLFFITVAGAPVTAFMATLAEEVTTPEFKWLPNPTRHG